MHSALFVLLTAAGWASARRSSEQPGLAATPPLVTTFLFTEKDKTEFEALDQTAQMGQLLAKLHVAFPALTDKDAMTVTGWGEFKNKYTAYGTTEALDVNWTAGNDAAITAKKAKQNVAWASILGLASTGGSSEQTGSAAATPLVTTILFTEEEKTKFEALDQTTQNAQLLAKLQVAFPTSTDKDAMTVTGWGEFKNKYTAYGTTEALDVNWTAGNDPAITAKKTKINVVWASILGLVSTGGSSERTGSAAATPLVTTILFTEEEKTRFEALDQTTQNAQLLAKLQVAFPASTDKNTMTVTGWGEFKNKYTAYGTTEALDVNWTVGNDATITAGEAKINVVWASASH